MYKQMAIASGSDNNHVSLRHSPRHFPEGNLVYASLLGKASPIRLSVRSALFLEAF